MPRIGLKVHSIYKLFINIIRTDERNEIYHQHTIHTIHTRQPLEIDYLRQIEKIFLCWVLTNAMYAVIVSVSESTLNV